MAERALIRSTEREAFIEAQVRSGAYPDREALIADAVDQLRERISDDAAHDAKLARLNAKLQEGLDSLDRGEGIEVTDLNAHFDEMMQRVRAR